MKQTLLHLEGVTTATVELAEGWASFQLAPDRQLDPLAVQQVVEDAGLTLYAIQIEALGEVQKQDGPLTFRVSGTDQTFPLAANTLARQMAQASHDRPQQWRVVGTLSAAPGATDRLTLERFARP